MRRAALIRHELAERDAASLERGQHQSASSSHRVRASGQRGDRALGGEAEPGGTGRVLRAAAQTLLLAAADPQRLERRRRAGATARRCPWARAACDRRSRRSRRRARATSSGDLAERLRGVDVEVAAGRAAPHRRARSRRPAARCRSRSAPCTIATTRGVAVDRVGDRRRDRPRRRRSRARPRRPARPSPRAAPPTRRPPGARSTTPRSRPVLARAPRRARASASASVQPLVHTMSPRRRPRRRARRAGASRAVVDAAARRGALRVRARSDCPTPCASPRSSGRGPRRRRGSRRRCRGRLAMLTSELGVYIHFPWCRKLCPYCDFAVEVRRAAARAPTSTPSSASSTARRRVRRRAGVDLPRRRHAVAVATRLHRARDRRDPRALRPTAPREITIEANPTDCTDERTSRRGAPPASTGCRSACSRSTPRARRARPRSPVRRRPRRASTRTLAAGFAAVGRLHPRRARRPPTRARAGRSRPVAEHPLGLRADDRGPHRVRPARPRRPAGPARRGRARPSSTSRRTIALTAAGFEHYEISLVRAARPARRAQQPVLARRRVPRPRRRRGVARARRGRRRRRAATNPRRAADYLAAPGPPGSPSAPRSTPREMAIDRAWLGHADLRRRRRAVRRWRRGWPTGCVAEGLAERRGDRICPTLRGFLMADRVAARIVSRR